MHAYLIFNSHLDLDRTQIHKYCIIYSKIARIQLIIILDLIKI